MLQAYPRKNAELRFLVSKLLCVAGCRGLWRTGGVAIDPSGESTSGANAHRYLGSAGVEKPDSTVLSLCAND